LFAGGPVVFTVNMRFVSRQKFWTLRDALLIAAGAIVTDPAGNGPGRRGP